jgi:tetratricopeptide (TPR) repeat protein
MAEDAATPDNTQTSDKGLSVAANRATVTSARIAAVSAVIAVAAIIVAVATAVYSSHLAQQQNNYTQRQELVSLINDITQEQQTPRTASRNAISSQLLVLGEAEEAYNIIRDLNSDVSQVEKYLVALGLADGGDYQTASQLYVEAARERSEPRTTADAWRGAAAAQYALGNDPKAETDIREAVQAFDTLTNKAYTYLFDITYRAAIPDCLTAKNEWNQAAQLTQEHHNILAGNNAMTTEKNARMALIDMCKVASGALEKIYIAPQT